ncbi:MAG TPA: hypothetical protein VKB67_14790, partial [Rhizomicrobium sp.]|nr:hypothetical protein [Rhizomicrobium sp.]
ASIASANTPNNSLRALSNDDVAQPQGSSFGDNTNSDVSTPPFNNRVRQDRTDMRPMNDRDRNKFLPGVDASGVPDPRI